MRILNSKHDGQILVSNAARFTTEVELLLAQMKCNPLAGPGVVDCRKLQMPQHDSMARAVHWQTYQCRIALASKTAIAFLKGSDPTFDV